MSLGGAHTLKWEEGSSLTDKKRHVVLCVGLRVHKASQALVEVIACTPYSEHVLGLGFHFHYLRVFV